MWGTIACTSISHRDTSFTIARLARSVHSFCTYCIRLHRESVSHCKEMCVPCIQCTFDCYMRFWFYCGVNYPAINKLHMISAYCAIFCMVKKNNKFHCRWSDGRYKSISIRLHSRIYHIGTQMNMVVSQLDK